jgi:hypothetical protein
MSTLTQDNKDFSNFHSEPKRRYLLVLRIHGLRADFVGELAVEPEPKYRTRLKRCIDSLDALLEFYDGGCEGRCSYD